ncbi:hypothetical protein ACC728_30985 [Rhizobium ruizarguesonis]
MVVSQSSNQSNHNEIDIEVEGEMLDVTSRTLTKTFGFFGFALLTICLLLSLPWTKEMFSEEGVAFNPTDVQCRSNLKTEAQPSDGAGILRVIDVWPRQTSINRHVCVSVAGVVSAVTERRLAEEVVRAQKARDDAKVVYDSAPEVDRNAAWEKFQKAEAALATALAASANVPSPVDLSVFLNGKTAPQLKVKAFAISKPQVLQFSLVVPPNATDEGVSFWRSLLSGGPIGTEKFGEKKVAIGLSRSAATMPETVVEELLTVVIYDPVTLTVGALSFFFFVLCFCGLARHTTVLRDNARTGPTSSLTSEALVAARTAEANTKTQLKSAEEALKQASDVVGEAKTAVDSAPDQAAKDQAGAKLQQANVALNMAEASKSAAATALAAATTSLKAAEDSAVQGAGSGNVEQPLGPYSLARTQMAFWLFLTLAGFIFLWLSMGLYLGLITSGILVLLGINATTGLVSIRMNDEKDKQSTSRSFLADIINDGEGPTLHRIQVVAWTLVLGIIFVWNVFWNFNFVNFDTNLLLLLGVAQSMYLGFKWQEAPPKS